MNCSVSEIAVIINAACEVKSEASIEQLLTDSRALAYPETSLFFALKTRTNDGHKYIDELYAHGVRSFVVSNEYRPSKATANANFLAVKNVLKALQTLATFHRRQFDVPVIGITGSNGKTVVKELLFQLLRNDFNIVRSPRSFNSQTGVPLSVWEMNSAHNLGIFEAGISMPDEMDNLRPIIAPSIGLITNIGEAHQKNFRSLKEKCMEKLSLFTDSKLIIYNADDELIESALEATCLSFKAVGWSRRNEDAPVFVNNIQRGNTNSVLTVTTMGLTRDFTVPFTDDAFIEDVIHCIAVMFYLRPTTLLGKEEAFRTLEPVAMRLETKEGVNGCQLINDTYNSDVNSLSIALDFQQSRRAEKKLKTTVILSDIMQTGMWPEYLYSRVAELLRRKKTERLIGIGKDVSECAKLFTNLEKNFYPTTEAFIKAFKPSMFRDEIILLKGSRSFHFEKLTALLEKKAHETVLEVNLDAVIHNYNYFRSLLKPTTKMICMVKAFGYGVGAYELAKTLQDYHCDFLAVALADEGEELRKEGIHIPIIVMNPEMSALNALFEHALEPEVYSFRLLDALIKEALRRGVTAFPVHIKFDTGMHRLGFEPNDVPELCRRLKTQKALAVRSCFSHLAGSEAPEFDEFTFKQNKLFTDAATALENGLGYKCLKHILNSAGIERFTDLQHDMVRLGISLYGLSASSEHNDRLRCVCALRSVILQIRNIAAGESVGYDRRTFLQRNSRIAVVPVGYADGLNRRLGNGIGVAVVGDKRCPVVGNICMDACMLDVTDATAAEGDIVTFFDENLTVNELADKIGTIPYEILTSISPRVKRVYFRE
jgi:alanine racemase